MAMSSWSRPLASKKDIQQLTNKEMKYLLSMRDPFVTVRIRPSQLAFAA